MTTEQEVQELTQKVEAISTGLSTAVTLIQEEFATLEKQIGEGKSGTEVNVAPLKAAIEKLEPVATQIEGLKPVPPTPPAQGTEAARQNV